MIHRKSLFGFMQVLSLAKLPFGETFLEKIATKMVWRSINQPR
jgi:hypothetical protein